MVCRCYLVAFLNRTPLYVVWLGVDLGTFAMNTHVKNNKQQKEVELSPHILVTSPYSTICMSWGSNNGKLSSNTILLMFHEFVNAMQI